MTAGSGVRVLRGRHAGKVSYHYDEGDRAVVYFGEPIRWGYLLIQRTTSST